jgi:hypothetical protein
MAAFETWRPGEELLSWQIPASFQGTFDRVRPDTTRETLSYVAHLVNTDPANTNFFVALYVPRNSLFPYIMRPQMVQVVHGSGKSADCVALERTVNVWCRTGPTICRAQNIVIEDFDPEE